MGECGIIIIRISKVVVNFKIMKNLCILLALLCIPFLLMTGCAPAAPYREDFFAMDTYMTITVYGKQAEQAADACITEIRRLDAMFDKNEPAGEIYRLNHAGGQALVVPPEVLELLEISQTCAQQTGGKFDPTIEPVSSLWDIHSGQGHVPSQEELEAALQKVGWDKLVLTQSTAQLLDGAQLDLGGIAKGYAADRAVAILREYGVERAILSLGGNVYVLGQRDEKTPWKVGIQDPDDKTRTRGTLSVRDCSVVTSGDYERYFEQDGVRYHHIFDPASGFPGNTGVRSVTVVCDSSTRADAYSTALFLMGPEQGLEFYRTQGGFEAVFLLSDGTALCTDGIASAFSLS